MITTKTFDAADGTLLEIYDPLFNKLDAFGQDGEIWNGRVRRKTSGTNTSVYGYAVTPASPDYEVSADLYIAGLVSAMNAGVIARRVGNNFYMARYRVGSGFQLYKHEGTSATQLGSTAAQAVSVGQTWRIRLRCVGSTISLFVNEETSPRISVTDATYKAAGTPGLWLGTTENDNGVMVDNFYAENLTAGSPPTGTVTIGTITPGSTSASVPYSYSAADQTGFEYRLNGGTAANLGTSPATISGLTASTPYSIEVRAINASGAGAWSAAVNFTTGAPSGDTDPPTLTGTVTFASITQTSYTAQWPAGSDNVAVTGYEYQIGSTAGAWTDAGNNLSAAIAGRTAGATETVYVRAYDAAGLRSTPAISGSVTLESIPASGINVTEPLKNNTGTLLANVSGVRVAVLEAATLAGVYETSGLTTNASGILAPITDASITTGQQYHVAIKLADGSVGITGPITAS